MQSYEVISGPLADAAVWRGALIWALALYVPCLLYTSDAADE